MRRALFLLAFAVFALGFQAGSADAATKHRYSTTAKKSGVVKKSVVVRKTGRATRHAAGKRYRSRVAAVPLRHRDDEAKAVVLERMGDPGLRSASALVIDQSNGAILFEKNADVRVPIASITKLMTAMVVLDANQDLDEVLTIAQSEVEAARGSRSRLRVGTQLSREEMLRLALMSSENRAAAALASNYVGGREAFIEAMNQKAMALGLKDTHFEDPTGLTAANVSSARDLTGLVAAAHRYPLIRQYSTTPEYAVSVAGRPRLFHNTNSLVRSDSWEIGLSKTGYINEAGKCLVMQAWLNNRPTIIVLLDSWGRQTRIGDANRIKRWIENLALVQRPDAS